MVPAVGCGSRPPTACTPLGARWPSSWATGWADGRVTGPPAGWSEPVAGGPSKTQRQHRIGRLLAERPVSSQAQLVELLAADGVAATQATVSRDLDELGAIKVRVPGGDLVYAIPELTTEQVAPPDHLRRVLGDWV